MKIFVSGLVVVAAFTLTGCSKKKDPEPSKEQLLAHSKGWKLTDLTATSTAGVVTSLFPLFSLCATDNILTFQSNGTYTETEGSSKCDATDPETVETGNWAFSDNYTTLVLTPVGDDPESFGVTLTASTLTVTIKNKSGSSPYTYRQILTAQ